MTSVAQTRSRASSSEGDDRSENMKMPNVSIEGERQTPDIFFVFPTGKGGNLSAPRMRDYANDILEPVVKPWFEKDQAVNPAVRVSSGEKQFNWDEALRSEPDRPQPVAPPANVAPPPPQMPPPRLPPQAQMLPPASQGQLGAPSYPSQAPSYPSQATSYPSVPTANRPHYPEGYPAPSTATAPSYPSAPAASAPSYPAPASAPPQIPSQALSLPQSKPQPGIPSWATQPPPPGPYQR